MKLFLCYAHEDRADLEVLEQRLKPLKDEGWIDAWSDRSIELGADWQSEIRRALRQCDAGVFLITPAFRASDFIRSEEQKELLQRYQRQEVQIFPLLLRSCDLVGSGFEATQYLPNDGKFLYRSPSDPIAEGERWTAITEAIRRKAEEHRIRPRVVRMPYPGMRSFEPSQADLFVGRDEESATLARRLEGDRRLLILFGDSGSGKSSLAKAGVAPALLSRPGADKDLAVLCKPSGAGANARDPFLAFAIRLHRCLGDNAPDEAEVAHALRQNPVAVRRYVGMALGGRDPRAELIVVVDQFEELFTVVDETLRQPFVELIDLLASQERVRVLLTVRHDFYPAMDRYPALVARINADASQRVVALGADRFREIITQPARQAGFTFEEGLVDRIITDARQLGNERAVVPLLAYALREMVEPLAERIERREPLTVAERVLGHARYDELGGVAGAIAEAARRAVVGLQDEERLLDRLASRLVTVTMSEQQPARIAARLDEFTADPDLQDLVERLVRQRLLVVGDTTVEVAHEALFQAWPALRDWVARHKDALHQRARLEQDARHWAASGESERDRDRALLWPHERQEPLYEALARLGESVETLPEPLRTFARPEALRLLDEIEDAATDHERRDWIGRRWCEIGDPRAGVGLRGDGLPDIVWCNIPGGVVTLGDAARTSDEVKPFRLARYLLTRSQYEPFRSRPDGYDNDEWWDGIARPNLRWNPSTVAPNYPVGLFTWYEAIAYCRWLTFRFREIGLMGSAHEIRLPSEFELQQACGRIGSGSVYPWHIGFEPALCKSEESEFMRMTSVGLYPQGATEHGAFDMGGNIWEWCVNRQPEIEEFSADVNGQAPSTVGGAGRGSERVAAVAWQRRIFPGYIRDLISFRVSCGSPIVDS